MSSAISVLLPKTSRLTRYFWLFIIIHTLIWTIGPAIFRSTLPHDTLEGITWGMQWQLGYNKHPFLTAWLCAGVTQIFGTVGWPVYLLAQLAVSITFIATWQLAKQFLSPVQSLLASLALEGVLFYNINSFNLTPDTLQSPLWALLSLFFYKALITQRISHWILTGLFAALSLLTKYQIMILFCPMTLFCFINPNARSSFKKPGLYIAVIVFFLLILPHLIWLFNHQFITLRYAEHVSEYYTQSKNTLNHIVFPLRMFINYFISITGLLFLLWPFYRSKSNTHSLNDFNWQFLLFIGLGPAILTLLINALAGDYFPPRWATPYFFAIGILTIAWINPKITVNQLKQFSLTLILFSLFLFFTRMISMTLLPRVSSDAYLPNQHIARSIAKIWHDHYHTKLHFVAGSNYLVSGVTPYLTDKPLPYLNWSQTSSPWVHESELYRHGGVFIWDKGHNFAWDLDSWVNTTLPPNLLTRFPELIVLNDLTFFRTSDHSKVVLGIALLPPHRTI
jgi:4-amino-4-deoxy-L-arabinose transferase-like glycosyltransferase